MCARNFNFRDRSYCAPPPAARSGLPGASRSSPYISCTSGPVLPVRVPLSRVFAYVRTRRGLMENRELQARHGRGTPELRRAAGSLAALMVFGRRGFDFWLLCHGKGRHRHSRLVRLIAWIEKQLDC